MAANFSRVNARRDQYDRLAVLQRITRGPAGAKAARVGQFGVELPVRVEPSQVLRARNDKGDERRPQCRLAELAEIDAIARAGQRLVMAHQNRPFDELAIVPGLEPENGPRRGDRGSSPAAGGGRRRGGGAPRAPLLGGYGCRQQNSGQRQEHAVSQHQCPLVVTAGAVSPVPIQCANHVRMRSSRSTSNHGGPVRDKPWKERGYRTNSAGTPRLRSDMNSCSASVMGTRLSSSECTISIGVCMLVA